MRMDLFVERESLYLYLPGWQNGDQIMILYFQGIKIHKYAITSCKSRYTCVTAQNKIDFIELYVDNEIGI